MLVSRKHKRSAGKAPQPPKDPNARQLEVTADRFVFSSQDTDYAVLAAHDCDDNSVRLTGPLTHVAVGESLTVKGRWTRHPQHGFNFKVSDAVTTRPKGLVGIASYLEHSLHGVGPATAQKIVDHFGQDTLEILDNNPERLAEVAGLGAKKAKAAMEHWADQQATRTVMLFLQQNSVPTWAATRIYRAYGEGSIGRIHENPYVITELERVGFKTADELALNMGLALNDPRRIDAGIVWVLRQAEEQGVATGKDKSGRERRLPGGNCYLPLADLIGAVRYTLSVDEAELVDERIRHQATAGRVVIESSSSGERHVYTPRMHDAEKRLASKIRSLLDSPVGFEMPDELKIPSETMNPTDQQLQAIEQALSCRLSVLTGNPGSGKTATLALLVETIEQHGHTIQLCAPTGKAAKRMTEATGHEAKTIHRLLEWQPFGTGFARNRRNPIDCDVLVVDEASMVDLLLADKLFDAIDPARTHVVLVGDIDQLPPVGAGRVLADIIQSRTVPTVRLTKIFRQAARSMIIQAAYAVNRGNIPNLDPKAAAEASGIEENEILKDYYFIPREENQDIMNLTLSFAASRIPRQYGLNPITEVQVIAPQRSTLVGVNAMNEKLQATLNPKGQPIGAKGFRVGDKLLNRRNDYHNDIMNGEFARITNFMPEESLVELDVDGRRVKMGASDVAENFVLAYAVTCHSMQGSSAKAVVIPLSSSFYTMLSRPLLYTAITRAEQLCIVIGQSRAMAMAVSSTEADKRWTALTQRLVDPSLSGQLI
jgi:exodeoxyribonuclease V alpha subunit